MNSPIIRHASLADIDKIIALERACFTTDIMSRNSVRHFLTGKTAQMIVAEASTKIIGTILILFRKNSHTARMYSLAVHASYRKQGTAVELCAAAERTAIKHGCDTMILEVNSSNAGAIRFYEKNGYKIFGEYLSFYECGTDALRMKKKL